MTAINVKVDLKVYSFEIRRQSKSQGYEHDESF